MAKELVESRLESLHKELVSLDTDGFFAQPVTEDVAPGYHKVIKHPMDFETMAHKLANHSYKTVTSYLRDFKLMCDNAMKYNEEGSGVYNAAKVLLDKGTEMIDRTKDDVEAALEEEARRAAGEPPGERIAPGVVLTRLDEHKSTSLNVVTHLPIKPHTARLGALMTPLRSIMPTNTIEKEWFGATPVTDITPPARHSYEPTYDSSKATLNDNESSMLVDWDVPWEIDSEEHESDTLSLCRTVLDASKRMSSASAKRHTAIYERLIRLETKLARSVSEPEELLLSKEGSHAPDESTQGPSAATTMNGHAGTTASHSPRPSSAMSMSSAPSAEVADTSMTDDSHQNQDEVQRCLQELSHLQHKRVATGRPWQLLAEEKTLAEKTVQLLTRRMLKFRPQELAHIPSVRQAMGVSVTKPKGQRRRRTRRRSKTEQSE